MNEEFESMIKMRVEYIVANSLPPYGCDIVDRLQITIRGMNIKESIHHINVNPLETTTDAAIDGVLASFGAHLKKYLGTTSNEVES